MLEAFAAMVKTRRRVIAAGVLLALGAGLTAQGVGSAYLIAPPASLPAVERRIARTFPDVRQLPPAALSGLVGEGGTPVLLVDVREADEYAVSRLDGALRIDPGASASDVAALIGKRAAGAEIVFYCSVGQRSSAMAQRAQSALARGGAHGVHNLQGGIFAWRNGKRPVVNDWGPTEYVHPYNEKWGRLLDNADLGAYSPQGAR